MNRADPTACCCGMRRWRKPRRGPRTNPKELQSDEQEFLAACRQAQDAVERERRQSRRILVLGVVAFFVADAGHCFSHLGP